MAVQNAAEIPPNTRVTKPGYGYRGLLLRYESRHRTRWAVVAWDGRVGTAQEYPHAIARQED